MIVFIVACLFALAIPDLPALDAIYSLFFIAFILFLLQFKFRHLWILSIICFALAWSWWQAGMVLQGVSELPDQKSIVTVQGTIVSVPQVHHHYAKLLLHVDCLAQQKKSLTVLLSWYDNHLPRLQAGQRWQFNVKLKAPRGLANPGGFDFAAWALQQRIQATGFIVKRGQPILLAPAKQHLSFWRQIVAEQLQRYFPDNGLFPAILLGLRDRMQATHWQVLQATGTSHLLAISGLHISLAAGLWYVLVNLLWRAIPRLCLIRPAQDVAAVAAIFGGFVYAAMAGFSIPTQRALVMIVIAMLAKLKRHRVLSWHNLQLAAVVVLFYDPLAALSPGFYLSFAAVACLILSHRTGLSWWRQTLRAQVFVTVGMLPLTAFWFQQISSLSLLANLLAIPLFSFLIIPCCLIGTLLLMLYPPLGVVVLSVAQWVLSLLWWYLSSLANVPLSLIPVTMTSIWQMLALTALALLFLRTKEISKKCLCLLSACAVLLLYQPNRINTGAFKVTQLDVGQGLASVVQTKHHQLIFDTGPRSASGLDSGQSVIVPYLRQQGVKHIDVMMISHGDNDHIGGAKSLLSNMPVKKILTTVPQRFSHQRSDYCLAGQTWQWDGVTFTVLHPTQAIAKVTNNHSCVLKIDNGQHSVLLTGDIEWRAEQELIVRQAEKIKASILVAPHHGSKTSSSEDFIDAVQPSIVIFSTGFKNRFAFPHHKVVARYVQRGISMINTADSGAVEMSIDQEIEIKRFRMDKKKFWYL